LSLLKTVPSENAPDELQPLIQWFMDTVGLVPPSLNLLSTNPALQSLQAILISYYREASNLSSRLQGLIRYLTAVALEVEPYIQFTARALAVHGMTEEQIAALRVNPAAAPLDEREGWLLALVIKAVRTPETFSEGHVAKLRDLGWTDTDILDALYLSFTMVGMAGLMKALKVE
jgi:alkylhydroperoxidase family enzyme